MKNKITTIKKYMFAAILALAFTVFVAAQEERHFDSEVADEYMDAVGLYFQLYKPDLPGPRIVITMEAVEQATIKLAKLDLLCKSKYAGIKNYRDYNMCEMSVSEKCRFTK